MSYSIRQLFTINQTIEKVVSKTKYQFEEFAEEFFSKIQPYNFDNAIKILEQKLNTLIKNEQKNFYDEIMRSALEQLDFLSQRRDTLDLSDYVNNKQNRNLAYIDESAQFNCQEMVAKKAEQFNCQRKIVLSEQQNQEISNNQIRKQINNFFTHQIQQKLSCSKIGEKNQTQVIKLFAAAEYDSYDGQLKIDLNKLGGLSDYEKEIGELKQSYGQMEERLRQCLPLAQAIKSKLTTLKVINVSSRVKFDFNGSQYFGCSVSAFELFKVIHLNKELTSVALKGIQIKQFQQCTKILNPSKYNALAEKQREEYSWINHFKPSKSLKLAINARINIDTNSKQLPSISKDLQLFIGMFEQLSDVTVKIKCRKIGKIGKERLEDLLRQLRRIKRIKIEIYGFFCSSKQLSSLLVALSSFTEIAHITFIDIREDSLVVIEERLSDLFKNNQITHLGLSFNYGGYPQLPKLPFLPTLQSIYLIDGSIQPNLFAKFTKTIPNVKSVRLLGIHSSKIWTINEQLFDQLQTLIIYNCKEFTFDAMRSKSPSNIKLLSIHNCDECLPVILLKLAKIERLFLDGFGDKQKLLSVPSPYLRTLELWDSPNLSDGWLKAIDQKWPNLTTLQLQRDSNQITPRGWSICGFKGLIQMNDFIRMTQAQRKGVFLGIRKRGIRIG